MFRLFHDNRLALAPIPETTKNVLDIATGTGIWATEFGIVKSQPKPRVPLTSPAEEHPLCKVVGTDLSPIQPD